MYASINSLFDEDPKALYAALGGFGQQVTNGAVGELRGRRYAVGLRLDF